ncbi:type II secretory pathway family [Reticulomyxa filosa]|uniref:signal-recognition-particle GTPase n=1 Tax=Reticulomyxa filosa TaxID=46433 RepID=X6MMI4_RETFI|nr:type II secretory pathway family [Reticulomyxa filosa]|eukprot:ETO14290.1 type II secretory pathway family [Reticulomyxa filosa]
MVLTELGSSLANALAKINRAPKIDDKILQILIADIERALLGADVSTKLVEKLKGNIREKLRLSELPAGVDVKRVIEKVECAQYKVAIQTKKQKGITVIKEITSLLDSERVAYVPRRGKSNVIMFVGLQGSGKTTTCTKLGYYYRVRGWKVGLVCCDTFRAGAFDQLEQNAIKAKIHFYGDRVETDPVKIALEGVKRFKEKKFEIIIVDTSGRHKQEESLFEEMEMIAHAVKPDDTILVVDSTNGQQLEAQAEAFRKRVDVASVIVTKLDGHAKGGGALSAVAATKAPIVFIGVGEHFNELQKFDTQRFVNRILGRGDIATIVEDMKEQKLDDQKELLEKMKKGIFTLRMMRDQFQNILKMGSFGSMMQMIPGLNNLPKESEEASQQRLQNFLVIMDSMTAEELDGDISLIETNPARQRRICRGAGVHINFIRELVMVYKPFAGFAKNMKKMPFGKNGEMPKNPNQMAKMANFLPENVLRQIGGQAGFMNLMQKFQSAEAGTALQSMQNMQSRMKGMQQMAKSQRRNRR